MRGGPAGQQDHRGSSLAGVSYDAAAGEIAAVFQAKLAGLRRRLPKREIPAAVRALREQKNMALYALRERRAAERFSDELDKRRLRPPAPDR